MQASERRNTLRAPLGTPVVEEYLTVEQKVIAVNISEHGMMYNRPAGSPSRKGEEVFLTFSLLERLRPIKALGWVVQETPLQDCIETHVTFMFLPAKDEEMIRDYVIGRAI